MRVEKINKGKGITFKNLMIFGLLAVAALLAPTLTGCMFPAKAAATTEPPANIASVSPSSKPTATPNPTVLPSQNIVDEPVITPEVQQLPELTYEQKKMILGVSDIVGLPSTCEGHELGNLFEITVKINKQEYRTPVYIIKSSDPGQSGVSKIYSVENDVYLFSIKLPSGTRVPSIKYYEYVTELNSTLKENNAEVVNSVALVVLAGRYKTLDIDYNNNDTLNEFYQIFNYGSEEEANALLKTYYSNDQTTDLSINSIPQEQLLPYWFYVPDVTIPEELADYYICQNTNPTPIVSPTNSRINIPSISYLIGEKSESEETEMENKLRKM